MVRLQNTTYVHCPKNPPDDSAHIRILARAHFEFRLHQLQRSHYKRYSVITITLHYVFALLHNALYLCRIVIASDSYRFRLFAGIIAYDSYRSELAGQHYRFTSLSF